MKHVVCETFWLGSPDYPDFNRLRHCTPLRFFAVTRGSELLLVRVEPKWTNAELGSDMICEPGCDDFLLLAPRLAGYSLRVPLAPQGIVPVYVLLPKLLPEHLPEVISENEYRLQVWGEAYASASDWPGEYVRSY